MDKIINRHQTVAGITGSISLITFILAWFILDTSVIEFICFLTFVISSVVTVIGLTKINKLRKFKNSGPKTFMKAIKTPYQSGSFYPEKGYNYAFISYGSLEFDGLENLPPNRSIGSGCVIPAEVLGDYLYLSQHKDGLGARRRVPLPTIVCGWPNTYLTPAQRKAKKDMDDFNSGKNQVFILSDGNYGKKPTNLLKE